MKIMKKLLTAMLCLLLMAVCLPVLEETALAASPYYVEVDITNQYVTVYVNGDTSNDGIVRQMICSTGKSSGSTPTGTFILPEKSRSTERSEWYRFSDCWGKWATRIKGPYLFHSVPYANKGDAAPIASKYALLGSPASAGCVRLRDEDAYWIAMNVPAGTKVKIYRSGVRNEDVRELLLDRTYSTDEESYDEFLGIAEALGEGSSGEEVLQAQIRLNLLGYDAGLADGNYGPSTTAAVKAFQAEKGLSQTGRITSRIWKYLFADDAPYSPIVIGSSGLHVKELQEALKTLKLYSGRITGIYDSATANAVRLYQSAYGMTVNGKATNAVRKSIVAKAEEVAAQFGDSEYKAVVVSSTRSLAKVNVSSTLNLRAAASTSSASLASLSNGTVLTVLQKGSSWTQVQHGAIVGYCKNSYLTFYTESSSSLDFELVDPSADPTPTPDPSATEKPVASTDVLTIGSEGDAVVTLQRALQELRFYKGELTGVYDEATAEAVKAFQTYNNLPVDGVATTTVQVWALDTAEEIKAQFGDANYDFVTTETTVTMGKIKVSSSLNIRASASTSSQKLTSLKNGTVVTVLEQGSTWSKIQYNNIIGYCMNKYLVLSTKTLVNSGYEIVPEPTPTPEPTPPPTSTPTPDPNATPKPVASAETLTIGSEGAAVVTLQRALQELRFYKGELTGVYDEATAEAVKTLQRYNGLTVDGIATTAVQTSALETAEEIKAQFGDADYDFVTTETTVVKGKIKVSSSLNIRASASTSSQKLTSLKNGTVVTVLEQGSTWSKIQYNNIIGYCMNKYLVLSTNTIVNSGYEIIPEPTPTPEPTATPEPTPTPDPNATPKPVASAETLTIGSEGAAVVTLQRALAELKLYSGKLSGIFDDATAVSVKTFQAANGLTADGVAATAVQTAILDKAEEIKNQFADSDYQANVTETTTTKAKVKVSSSLNVRASASTSSQKLTSLKNGTVVNVLEKGSSWSKIEYNGVIGYCKNTYLVFTTSTSTSVTYEPVATPEPTATPEVTADPTEVPAENDESSAEETEVTPAPETATPAPVQYAVVKADETILYKTAEADSAEENVFATVNAGEFFTVVEVADEWITVEYEGENAFVPADAVELTIVKPEPVAEISATEVPAATETPVPTETPAPTESPVPTETPEPTETPAPIATAPAVDGEHGESEETPVEEASIDESTETA